MEACLTLGLLGPGQAETLAAAGLDYYNHNIDTGAEFYERKVTTHTQEARVDTLTSVRQAGMKICCGGIIGMGETRRIRASLIALLAGMNPKNAAACQSPHSNGSSGRPAMTRAACSQASARMRCASAGER